MWLLQVAPTVDDIRSVVGDPVAVLILLALAVVALVVGGIREWYVWGPTHRARVAALERERDNEKTERKVWQDSSLDLTEVLKSNTSSVEVLARRGRS
jgi:capsular polysaccharide biosynthesis protein